MPNFLCRDVDGDYFCLYCGWYKLTPRILTLNERNDFTPNTTLVRSIRDIVLEDISFTHAEGKTDDPESIEELLERVYQLIERQALQVWHSNEIWALK